jgi:sporulation protein YlmC with PRC-barrel domain
MFSSFPLWAQPPKNSDSNSVNSEANDELDRGRIEVSNSVLHSKVVSEKGDVMGEISDLLLDLQHGHLSIVVIARRSPQAGKSRLIAAPWSSLRRNKENAFEISCPAEKLAGAPELDSKHEDANLTRRWASSVFGHFGMKERTIKREKSKSGEDYQLTRATSLENVRVNDLTGSELGHLAGFAIATRDGLLVYAGLAVTKSDQGLQAIPLSAFIVKSSQTEWFLDISEEALAERPGFPKSAWPVAIDRGWSEYVHVLYGRPVFEGVRSEPHAVAVKP